ncbi:MAG TPA: prolipoprotein diacylglyceryl transferase [Sandaracinaceae bacterium LLY-WYZ-13_1]|nr:prolipoprotein diacylglyceryl transferase [Sandaracinaceae bacterium LLY-WYZ-13_1]
MLLTLPWFQPEPIRIPLGGLGVEALPAHLELHPFGMLVAMGVLVGVTVARRKAIADGLHPGALGELAGYMLISAFVLGHVLDAVFYHWEVVVERPLFLLELWNGLSSFGGFVGAFVGSMAWVAMRGYSFVAFADPIAFSFPFGWLFGRLGCTVAHDHPGKVTDFFLAIEDYRIRGGFPPWQTRHDLGLYEVFWCLAMIPLFLWLGRRRRKRGFYLTILPLLYAPVRFGLDFLRATDVPQADPRLVAGVLTPGHLGAILLFSAGLFMAWRLLTRPEPVVPPDARLDPAGGDRAVDPDALAELLARAERGEGPRRVEPSEAWTTEASPRVTRWPGGLAVVDLRARALDDGDEEALAEAMLEAPTRLRVWLVGPDAETEDVAPLWAMRLGEAPGRDALVVVGAPRPERAIPAPPGVSIWVIEDPADPPWAAVALPDGAVAVGMRTPPTASS